MDPTILKIFIVFIGRYGDVPGIYSYFQYLFSIVSPLGLLYYHTVYFPHVTLRVTPHWNSDPHFSMTRTCSQTPYHVSLLSTNLNLELHVPDPAQPSPFHTLSRLPWPRLCNPVSDLLIPLLCSQPCIVPHSYKSEPPMYCRPSSNID